MCLVSISCMGEGMGRRKVTEDQKYLHVHVQLCVCYITWGEGTCPVH